ncbi:MAG: nitrate/nitrite transporter NrtS [Candidatus Rokubacteria bacterium]|nr:nitrate/nitrite transporter NrtS [Candidatus Rokubacteria bacterium]
MIWKALAVAALVGTILTVINQGDVLLAQEITRVGLIKILLTYAVPFCVSVYSVVAMSREPSDPRGSGRVSS